MHHGAISCKTRSCTTVTRSHAHLVPDEMLADNHHHVSEVGIPQCLLGLLLGPDSTVDSGNRRVWGRSTSTQGACLVVPRERSERVRSSVGATVVGVHKKKLGTVPVQSWMPSSPHRWTQKTTNVSVLERRVSLTLQQRQSTRAASGDQGAFVSKPAVYSKVALAVNTPGAFLTKTRVWEIHTIHCVWS